MPPTNPYQLVLTKLQGLQVPERYLQAKLTFRRDLDTLGPLHQLHCNEGEDIVSYPLVELATKPLCLRCIDLDPLSTDEPYAMLFRIHGYLQVVQGRSRIFQQHPDVLLAHPEAPTKLLQAARELERSERAVCVLLETELHQADLVSVIEGVHTALVDALQKITALRRDTRLQGHLEKAVQEHSERNSPVRLYHDQSPTLLGILSEGNIQDREALTFVATVDAFTVRNEGSHRVLALPRHVADWIRNEIQRLAHTSTAQHRSQVRQTWARCVTTTVPYNGDPAAAETAAGLWTPFGSGDLQQIDQAWEAALRLHG